MNAKVTTKTPTEKPLIEDNVDYKSVTEVNLVPKSLPESSQSCVILKSVCSFGMMDLSKQQAFVKMFHDMVVAEWGTKTIDAFDRVPFEKRINLIYQCTNNFFKQYTSVVKINDIGLIGGFPGSVSARYEPEFHKILFAPALISTSISDTSSAAYVAGALYHEMRHAEQVQMIARFMESRGQKLAGTEGDTFSDDTFNKDRIIDPSFGIHINIWKNVPNANDKNCINEIKKGHPYYGCVVRWYAGNFGIVEKEAQYKPNIYEDPDYPIDKSMSLTAVRAIESAYSKALDESSLYWHQMKDAPNDPATKKKYDESEKHVHDTKLAKDRSYQTGRPMETDGLAIGFEIMELYSKTYGTANKPSTPRKKDTK